MFYMTFYMVFCTYSSWSKCVTNSLSNFIVDLAIKDNRYGIQIFPEWPGQQLIAHGDGDVFILSCH